MFCTHKEIAPRRKPERVSERERERERERVREGTGPSISKLWNRSSILSVSVSQHMSSCCQRSKKLSIFKGERKKTTTAAAAAGTTIRSRRIKTNWSSTQRWFRTEDVDFNDVTLRSVDTKIFLEQF